MIDWKRPWGSGSVSDLLPRSGGHGGASYSWLALRLEREFPVSERGRSVQVTAADDDNAGVEAITELAWHLAEDLGHAVLMIDATFGLSTLTRSFGITESPGLVDVLSDGNVGRTMLRAAALPTKHEKVDLLPRGLGDNGRLIAARSAAVDELLITATECYDFVLILGSLMDESSRSVAFGAFVDATLLVAVEGKTLLTSIQNGQRALSETGASRIALVLSSSH